MLQKPKCPVIALEEHYWDEELAAHAKVVERKDDETYVVGVPPTKQVRFTIQLQYR